MVHTEPLSGGLVTAKDPSLLAPSELSQTDDLFYKPASPSLHKALGRTRFNSTALTTAAAGLRYCGFDSANDLLIALSGTTLQKAIADETGSFSSLATGISGSSLEAVHYNNRHVLLTGGSNKVLLPDSTTRSHGLQPVTAGPGLVHATGAGTWPLGADQLGFFEYWTTEVFKTDTEDIESTFTGTPNQVNVTASTSTVTITRPPAVNIDTTHWRIYRSTKKGSATETRFPIGYLIATVAIATESFVDGGGTTTALTLAGSGDNTLLNSRGGAGNWTSPGNVTLDDASNATSASVTWSDTHTPPQVSAMRAGTFGFTGIGNPITDITVQVEAKKTNFAGLQASLSWDGGSNWTTPQSYPITSSLTTMSLTGTWGRNWSGAEFVDGLFYVRLEAYGSKPSASGTIDVDFAKVSVSHGGTTGSQVTPFNAIIVQVNGAQSAIGAEGPPPTATTGDIFQESLVLNSVTYPTQVSYSMPGDIDAFPAIYLLKFDTKDKDSVTSIKSLGSVCLVGLASQVWRVNYLPREEDAEFDRGRCTEVVDTDHGIAGIHAAAKFTLDGQTMVGYVGQSGPRMTNGFQASTMTNDLDWESLVDISQLSKCILVNDARYHHLRLYYVPKGGSTLSKCLFLSYHQSHLKGGKLKVSGPASVSVLAATQGTGSSGEKLLYTSDGVGYVYVENRGSTDAQGTGIAPVLKTREMYLAGPGNEWELQDLFVHHQAASGGTYQTSFEVAKSNTDVRTTQLKPFTTLRRGLTKIAAFEAGEGIATKITGTNDGLPASFDYLVLNIKGAGLSDPFK
jgi:hypothetical protein